MEIWVKDLKTGESWKLDDDDKRRAKTDQNYMMGNGRFTIYGNDPRFMDAEMARCMSITKPIIY